MIVPRPDRQDSRLETHRAWPGEIHTWCGRPIRYTVVPPTDPETRIVLSLRDEGEEPSCLGCHYHYWRLSLIYG